jgi:transcriptional regulator with XRE-family HTH domain
MTDFGKLLDNLITHKGFSHPQFAKLIGVEPHILTRIIEGRSQIGSNLLSSMAQVLGLSEYETKDFIYQGTYRQALTPSTPTETTTLESAARNLQVRLSYAMKRTEELSSKLAEVEAKTPVIEQLQAEISAIRGSISDAKASGQELSASVTLPPESSMTLQLVRADSLERLEEYRADENRWFTWLGVFVGAIIGIIVNVATGGLFNVSTGIILAVFVLMAVFCWRAANDYQKRAENLKQELITKTPSRPQ